MNVDDGLGMYYGYLIETYSAFFGGFLYYFFVSREGHLDAEISHCLRCALYDLERCVVSAECVNDYIHILPFLSEITAF